MKPNSTVLSFVFLTILFSLSYSLMSVNAEVLEVEGFQIQYEIDGGTVDGITLDSFFGSLIIDIDATNNGQIEISIPRGLLDAKVGSSDDIFFILVDDFEVDFDETDADNSARTLLIPFSKESVVIEIIGTDVMQELSDKDTVKEEPKDDIKDIIEKETKTDSTASKGGGCLIATAAFDSELAPQVQQLREIRDTSLLQTESGSAFMESFNQFYYSFSPTVADWERQNPVFKETVKLAITPLLTSLSLLSLLNYVNFDSEETVFGYGVGIILLNIGMYFVLPAIVIHRVRKFV